MLVLGFISGSQEDFEHRIDVKTRTSIASLAFEMIALKRNQVIQFTFIRPIMPFRDLILIFTYLAAESTFHSFPPENQSNFEGFNYSWLLAYMKG